MSRNIKKTRKLNKKSKEPKETSIDKASSQMPTPEEVSAGILSGTYDPLYDNLTDKAEVDAWIDLYRSNTWIKAAAFAIAKVIAPLPIKLYKKATRSGKAKENSLEEVPTHPILALLDNPNPKETKFDVFEALSIYLDTVGYSYWEIVYDKGINNTGKHKRPAEFYNIRPSLLKPLISKDNRKVTGYVYQTKKWAKRIHFKPEEIIPFKYFNPLNDLIGQGSAQPAVNEIQLEAFMLQWNKAFFKKGTIEGMLTTDKPLTPKDIKDTQDMWRKARASETRNTIILGKGLKYDHFGLKPNEVDFLSGRKDNRTSILSCMGVPGVKVNLLDNAQYDNYKLQEEDFNRSTIIPRCKKIAGVLTKYLIPLYPDLVTKDGYEYVLQFDVTELLKEDVDKQNKRHIQQISHGIKTPNECRIELGEKPSEDVNMDKHYMHKTLIPLDLLDKIAQQEADKKSKDPNTLASKEEMGSKKEETKQYNAVLGGTDDS